MSIKRRIPSIPKGHIPPPRKAPSIVSQPSRGYRVIGGGESPKRRIPSIYTELPKMHKIKVASRHPTKTKK